MIVDDAQATYSFYYTGSYQTFTVPSENYACGAQGASAFYSSGGLGGNDVTTVAFTPRTYLYTYVGGAGRRSTGWYSGGAGFASGEGGSADVRTGSANRISRIVVAGGDLTGLSG